MKSILTTILLSTCTYAVIAAPVHNKKNRRASETYYQMQIAILQKQTSIANKPTATKKRLIANSYTTNGIVIDSNHYYYSNGRGSTHNNVESYYDNFYATSITNINKNILSDSSISWYYISGGLSKTRTNTFTYNSSNQVINHDYKTSGYHLGHAISYNSSGAIGSVTASDTLGGTAFIPKTVLHVKYNSQGKRIMDSTVNIQTGDHFYKRIYTYDGNGNMLKFESYQYTLGVWDLTYRAVYRYDIANRLVMNTSEYDFGSGLQNGTKDSFSYTGSNTQPAHHASFTWDAGTAQWAFDEKIINNYNTSGLLDTYYIYRYTTQWDTIERDVITYDSDGLILRTNGYLYNGNGTYSSTPYDQTTMYYKEYDPLAINTTSVTNSILLYPNPSQGNFYIKTAIQFSNVTITDIQGHIVYNTSLTETNIATIATQLPPGTYVLTPRNKQGIIIASVQFIIQ